MPSIDHVTLDVADATAAELFYKTAFGLGDAVRVRESQEPASGFRGFTLSLVVAQPGTVDSLVGTALEAGATELKPVQKSFWGYGGVVRAPDGTIGRSRPRPRRTPGRRPVGSTTWRSCSESRT